MNMKNVLCVLLTVVSAVWAGDVKETKKYVETNGWDECVRRFDQGTIRMGNFELYAVTSYGWGATNAVIFGQSFGRHECTKEHISDYPKVSMRVEGVQWVREYEQVGDVGGTVVTSKWMRYDFPHEKITTKTKQEVKIVTTVVTNKVVTKDTKCGNCGKR